MTDWPRVPYVGVGCVLLRAGRILLVRRHGVHGAGSWSTPGGHLEFGESPARCAARETLEETGVTVSNLEFLAITNDLFDEDEKHYITIWMSGQPDESEAKISAPDEIAEMGWFEPGSLPTPLFLGFGNLLAGRCMPGSPSNFPPDLLGRVT